MKIYLITGLISFAVLIALLPKNILLNTKNILINYLGISKSRAEAKPVLLSRNKLSDKILNLAKRVYYIIPIQIRMIRHQKTVRLLQYSGFETYGMEVIIGLRFLCLFAAFAYSVFIYALSRDTILIIFGLIFSVLCFFIPEKFLEIKVQKRMVNIQKSIPSVLTSGAIMLDAGMNIQQMLECVSDASVNDLSRTLRRALHKVKMGVSLSKALEETLDTCSIDEYRSFVSILIQGLEHGASGIADSVRKLALDSWDARKRIAQNLAQKASMKLFLPLVFLVLPAMLIFLLGPMLFYIGAFL